MKTVAVLGSTGSIGRSTLDVIRRNPRRFRVSALAAGSNLKLLAEQIREFRPRLVSILSRDDAAALARLSGPARTLIAFGPEGAEDVAAFDGSDVVVSAITGTNGLKPTLAAVRAGKTVALANKESMVVAGPLLRREARKSGANILPVDSEHSGVFQCLAGQDARAVRTVTLTASGGPFLRTPRGELARKSVAEAVAHPRWRMGRKVSVDSATLMNKGLELIEARHLFGLPPDKLRVLIHPQSVVHALVEMRDGSVLAQLGPADMRIPIQYALTYPERVESALPRLDLTVFSRLEFLPVDARRYPMFEYAVQALVGPPSAAVALNAANEVAVDAFLAGRVGFLGIQRTVGAVLAGYRPRTLGGLDDILAEDLAVRERTRNLIAKRT
ncbi:MAG: 1-deoxy-D-xylulose-5-phosphate reductoisomerase [Candidatus Aminicenantes bacterium]|nr:1-deoxy-D-xylulose-5-phosphate reductoisomerase [Candidatus Aminicenantes bacterium]